MTTKAVNFADLAATDVQAAYRLWQQAHGYPENLHDFHCGTGTMKTLSEVPGVPSYILDTLYHWQTVDSVDLSRVKTFFCGRDNVLFELQFRGDVDEGTAYITGTVLEVIGPKGNLSIVGELCIDSNGWHFTHAPWRLRKA